MEQNNLFKELLRDIKRNNNGGFSCYLRRIGLFRAIVLQKMKKNVLISVPLFFNKKMNVITGETVSRNLIAFGYTEVALTALMLKNLFDGDIFVDIGTHYGYEALLASEIVGTNGQVYSFEPNPTSFSIAEKNLKLPNCILYNYAVGDYNGIAKIESKDIEQSAFNSIVDKETPSVKSIEIKIVTLDDIMKNRKNAVKFIKCDVEGFEMQVLKGARQLIDEDRPLLVLEADMPINGKPSERAIQLQNYMATIGYIAYNFDLVDGNLKIETLGSFSVEHANVLFKPN